MASVEDMDAVTAEVMADTVMDMVVTAMVVVDMAAVVLVVVVMAAVVLVAVDMADTVAMDMEVIVVSYRPSRVGV